MYYWSKFLSLHKNSSLRQKVHMKSALLLEPQKHFVTTFDLLLYLALSKFWLMQYFQITANIRPCSSLHLQHLNLASICGQFLLFLLLNLAKKYIQPNISTLLLIFCITETLERFIFKSSSNSLMQFHRIFTQNQIPSALELFKKFLTRLQRQTYIQNVFTVQKMQQYFIVKQFIQLQTEIQ